MINLTEEQIREAAKVKDSIIDNQLDITGWNVSPDSTMRSMIRACMDIYSEWAMSQDQWVDVKETLPDRIRILAYTSGITITLTYIEGVYYTGNGNIWGSEVTHWQPLPTAPKKGAEHE